MLKELLKPEIKELIELHRWSQLKEALESWPAAEIADLILDIDKQGRVLLFRALPRNLAADVFSYFEHEQRQMLLFELTDQETKLLLADMSPDDRTSLLEELPAKVTRSLLNLLSPEDVKEARQLLGYPEDSIGRLMTPDFVAVKSQWTVAQTLEHIRKFGKDSETFDRVYVTDNDGKLLDEILLRNIILANSNVRLESLMDYTVISVSAFDDQEQAVKAMEKYDISALPVVDSEGKLVGIVTFDDIMDISEEEVTEDFQKIGAINPMEQSYFNASIWKLWSKRFPWLLGLLIANLFTTGVISYFSDIIQSVVALTFFMPMLIGTAGNTGTQSSTLIIRSLSIGDVKISDWYKVFRKEIIISLLLGAILGIFAYLRGALINDSHYNIAITVCFSMVILVVWANMIGAMLPILLAKFKLDPAVISSPFIATFLDITGLTIYFNIAVWIMNL
jgi:magnesium transporter